jgi:hypothetical protein
LPSPSIVVAGAALFIALGGTAVAADALISSGDIAKGAVTNPKIKDGAITSQKLKDGAIRLKDLHATTRESLHGTKGDAGVAGNAGAPGTAGAEGANGSNGAAGTAGSDGSAGTNGTNGTNGANGANGTNGTVTPLSATDVGVIPLPTATPPTEIIFLNVPAGNYVVLAKTQLSHTGAGDSVDCWLKAGSTTLDQISMKTLPALAAVPVSLQAAFTTSTSTTRLLVECDVLTANGTASFTSLIAIPTA